VKPRDIDPSRKMIPDAADALNPTVAPRRTRRRRFVHRVVALILAALACELALQLLTLVPSPRLRALREPALAKRLLDPELGHRGNPVWREYDESGFRNAVRPETAAIVAIGDSQTESQSVSRKNAWPQQLEAISGRRTYNMGLAGFGPAHYYALTDEALALSPELILVGLYAGNDFADAYLRVYEGGAAPELRSNIREETVESSPAEQPTAELAQEWHRAQQAADPSYRDWKHTLSEFVKTRFQLFALSRTLYRSVFVRVKLDRDNRPARWSTLQARAEAADDDVLFAVEFGAISTILTPSSSLSLLDREADPRIAEGWQLTLRAMRAMRERIGNRADLIVLFIPTKELVYATWLREVNAGQTFPEALERLAVVETALWRDTAAALDDTGIEYLDLLPALIGCLEVGEWPYNNNDDGHPIVCGNRAMAQAVATAVFGSPSAY
jgi:hypothetical protein